MITAHVPAVRVPPDHTGCRVAAAVTARGGVEDHGDPDAAPSARRPAAAQVAYLLRRWRKLAGPGRARMPDPCGARTVNEGLRDGRGLCR